MRTQHRPSTRRPWWWTWVVDPVDRRLVVLGPSDTEAEARDEGFNKVGHLSFEVVSLKTRDRTYARDIINAQRLGQSAQLEDIIRKKTKYKV